MRVIVFGASGTAGGAVLEACVKSAEVEEVRIVVRRPLGRTETKVKEFVHRDYGEYGAIAEAFRGVDAVLFCLGISVTQVSKEEYVKVSHDYPVAAARMLKQESPGGVLHYISGAGTNAEGRAFWRQVKGKTEKELMGEYEAVCWRPAFIDAKPSGNLPKVFVALTPVLRLMRPMKKWYVLGEDLGGAMLEATREGMRERTVENAEIRELGEAWWRRGGGTGEERG